MPDLSVLIELADYYEVDIREIIAGERKSENMDTETKDTLKKVAEYTAEEKKKLKNRLADMMIAAIVLLVFCTLLFESQGFGGRIPESSCRNMISFALGTAIAALALTVMYLFGVLDKIREKKLSLRKNKK